MLSYQHIYHAGNGADVQKHAVLARILSHLVKDKAPITFIETHAGRGVYDLKAPEALKTGEAQAGVMRIAGKNLPDAMMPWLKTISQVKGEYPGSPMIAARLLRSQDRLHLCELHPREFDALQKTCKDDRRISTYKEDGYQKATAVQGQRIVLLIDPSYEIKSEYEQAVTFVRDFHAAHPDAVILLWMPLLPAARHEAALADLEKTPSLWRQDALFATPGAVRGMYGSALAGLNIPKSLYPGLEEVGKWVSEHCKVG